MKKMFFLVLIFAFSQNTMMAQDSDFYRSTGKIYGVYGVVLVLLIGLIIYLFSLDKKISKIEKSIDNE